MQNGWILREFCPSVRYHLPYTFKYIESAIGYLFVPSLYFSMCLFDFFKCLRCCASETHERNIQFTRKKVNIWKITCGFKITAGMYFISGAYLS